jgi:hypothetical protein
VRTRALSARTLGRSIAEHPLVYVGGALSAGYLLGGGLRSRLGNRLLRIGGLAAWRFLIVPALERAIRERLTGRDSDGEE